MVKGPERSTFRDKQEERVFNIRLKQSNQEIDISNKPNLVKIIEQEYAVRYLECLNIEPSQKNIHMILKMYPLKNCEISASWKNDTGLYADTITITTRKKQEKKPKEGASEKADQEVIESLKLQKIKKPDIMLMEKLIQNQDQDPQQQQSNQQQQQQQNQQLSQEEEEKRNAQEQLPEIVQGFRLDFNPEVIKKKYIYPFNQTFIRKLNVGLKDEDQYQFQTDNPNEVKEKYLIYEQPQYHFPFSQVKLEKAEITDLQKPITIEIPEIKKLLEDFVKKFPQSIVPTVKQVELGEKMTGAKQYLKEMKNVQQEDNLNDRYRQESNEMDNNQDFLKGRHITFLQSDVNSVFKLLATQEMARLVGIACHFSYWVAFGNVNPIQIDGLAKKQMYIMMHEIKEYFCTKVNQKLWNSLGFPLLLLTIKMNVELIFKEHYGVFFEENSYNSNSAGHIAMDKIFTLIDKTFDETNFFGRFTFLESDFKTLNKQANVSNERQFMRKRLFATSPFLDIMINNPQDSKTRSILAKKHHSDLKENKSSNKSHVLQSLPKKKNASTIPVQYTRVDKSIYQEQDQRKKIEEAQKKKMVKMVMNKILPKIERTTGKKTIS